MLLTLVRNNYTGNKFSEEEDWSITHEEQRQELVNVFQNKTRPSPNQAEAPTEKEDIDRVIDMAGKNGPIITLGVDGSFVPVDVADLLEEEYDAAKSNDNAAANEGTRKEKFAGWLKASLGTATQILKEAQPSLNVSHKDEGQEILLTKVSVGPNVQSETKELQTTSKETTTPDDLIPEKAKEPNLKEEVDLAQVADEKDPFIDEISKHSNELVPEKAAEPNRKKEDDFVPVVEEKDPLCDEISKHPSSGFLTKGAQAAADSISRGAETTSAKARKLSKDGKLTNFVAAAAILGAGIGAAVLGTGGAVTPETTRDDGNVKMME